MANSITVPIVSLGNASDIPSYAYEGDAGFDLKAAKPCILEPFERKVVPCGFCLEIPDGHAGLVIPRSGLAAKHGITVVNAPGLIDSGYRGEIKVILMNLDSRERFVIEKGDRIAQMLIVAIPAVKLEPVSDLSDSSRGSKGFGSSGIADR